MARKYFKRSDGGPPFVDIRFPFGGRQEDVFLRMARGQAILQGHLHKRNGGLQGGFREGVQGFML